MRVARGVSGHLPMSCLLKDCPASQNSYSAALDGLCILPVRRFRRNFSPSGMPTDGMLLSLSPPQLQQQCGKGNQIVKGMSHNRDQQIRRGVSSQKSGEVQSEK